MHRWMPTEPECLQTCVDQPCGHSLKDKENSPYWIVKSAHRRRGTEALFEDSVSHDRPLYYSPVREDHAECFNKVIAGFSKKHKVEFDQEIINPEDIDKYEHTDSLRFHLNRLALDIAQEVEEIPDIEFTAAENKSLEHISERDRRILGLALPWDSNYLEKSVIALHQRIWDHRTRHNQEIDPEIFSSRAREPSIDVDLHVTELRGVATSCKDCSLSIRSATDDEIEAVAKVTGCSGQYPIVPSRKRRRKNNFGPRKRTKSSRRSNTASLSVADQASLSAAGPSSQPVAHHSVGDAAASTMAPSSGSSSMSSVQENDSAGAETTLASEKFGIPPREFFDVVWNVKSGDDPAKPKDISLELDVQLLTGGEVSLCKRRNLTPRKYLEYRSKIFRKYHGICDFDVNGQTTPETRGRWNVSQAQSLRGLNVNTIATMYRWYNKLELFDRSWPLQA